MPFYEYQCSRCGHHHEELQKIGGRLLRKCPACGRPALRRLVSAPVFRLKGGGWYETDFKADKEAQRNLAGDKEPEKKEPAPEKPDKPEKPKEAAPEPKPAAPAAERPEATAGPTPAAKPVPAKPRRARRRR